MSEQNINKLELIKEETVKSSFSFPCPHCQKTITSQDFQENNFLIAHLQSYFQNQEALYRTQLLQELASNPNSFPPYQNLLAEKEKLQLLVEGYKLGTQRGSKEKGEELEKYIAEKLQEVYNGHDE